MQCWCISACRYRHWCFRSGLDYQPCCENRYLPPFFLHKSFYTLPLLEATYTVSSRCVCCVHTAVLPASLMSSNGSHRSSGSVTPYFECSQSFLRNAVPVTNCWMLLSVALESGWIDWCCILLMQDCLGESLHTSQLTIPFLMWKSVM